MAHLAGIASKPGSQIEPSHPFIAAKPPTTDHLTYLTLLEYNLTEDNVTVLHHVLSEDANAGGSLFSDIGWDLVGLLLPLLRADASKACLMDIAKMGNPRECALKVEQGLRNIQWGDMDDGSEGGEVAADEDEGSLHPLLRHGKVHSHDAPDAARDGRDPEIEDLEQSLPLVQFKTLLSMLKMLHPRIKTKQPSRFIATTLSAVLAAMSGALPRCHDECCGEAPTLVEALRASRRPTLPPRGTSSTGASSGILGDAALDPNAGTAEVAQEPLDLKIEKKLLQSFITHVAELWMSSLDASVVEETADVPALAWANRFQEQDQPRMQVPGRISLRQQFDTVQELQKRDDYCIKLCQVTRNLGLGTQELLANLLRSTGEGHADEVSATEDDESKDQDGLPEKPEDVPLSQVGCLLLLTAQHFACSIEDRLYSSQLRSLAPVSLHVFPEIAIILKNLVGAAEDVMVSTAALPNAVVDATLFLALDTLSRNAVGDPAVAFPHDKDAFPRFLQLTSLLSANVPNSSIRYCAHVVTATVLRSHPEPAVRLGFIKDTLEHAPMDSLRAEAVGWLKGEIIEANIMPANADDGSEHNIFKASIALDSVSVHLYPDLRTLIPTVVNSSVPETGPRPAEIFAEAVKPRLPFFLAVLNFHYLLLSIPPQARERLDVLNLHKEADVGAGFLTPLREAAKKAEEYLKNEGVEDGAATEMLSDAILLQQAIAQVERRLLAVAKEGR